MTVADFSGAEAEELRRAVGMRRSWQRMEQLEEKLRSGMTKNGLDSKTQENIIQNITSFALYGFPESHAASFALIAYASAYFKVRYLAAFTCAILNNQPMGFYSPAVLVKDAQRHGLRIRPIDVQLSDWTCSIEHESNGELSMRLGLMYAKGMRKGNRAIHRCRTLAIRAFPLRGRPNGARPVIASQRADAVGAYWGDGCAQWHRPSPGCGLAGRRNRQACRSLTCICS